MARSEQAATEPGNKPGGGFSWRLEFEAAAAGVRGWCILLEDDQGDVNGSIDHEEDEPVSNEDFSCWQDEDEDGDDQKNR